MISTNFSWFDRSQTDQTMRCRHHSPFPSFEGCEACRTQPGCYRRQGRPHQGETCEVRHLCAPAMLSLTHPSRHVTQNPNPRQQATATGRRYHNTQHTTHKTTTASAAGPRTQHTARLPPRPQTRRVTQRGCLFNVPRRGQVTPVPPAPARPTPCRASCDGSPHPCTSQAHPMQVLTVPHAQSCVMQPRRDSRPTTQGNNTAPPRCPHPWTRRQNHRTRSHPCAHTAHYPRCPHTTSNLLAMLARR
jgi:hypothetical protein